MDHFNRIKKLLDDYSLDAVLISNCYNMRYLSGFTGGEGYLFFTREKRILLTDFRYRIQADEESPDFMVMEVDGDYSTIIKELAFMEQAKVIGFESKDISCMKYLLWAENWKEIILKPLKDEITDLRRIKYPWELERIRKAEAIGDLAFSKILEIIKPGMTELEVSAHLEFIMKSLGGEKLSFDTIVASGIHSSMPHWTPDHTILQKGDFVTLDFGCVYEGYCSDMTRTIVLGKASWEQKKIYQIVLEAQLAALDFIKAGYTGREIDRVSRNFIDKAGYQDCFGHGLGHSVGLFIHENPRLSKKEDAIIQSGMVETIEPGIYIKGFGGVRIEDLVQVTESGYVNYTSSSKKIIEL